LAKHNNKWLKVVTYLFGVSVILLLAVGLIAWRIFSDVIVVEGQLHSAVRTIDELSKRLEKTEKNVQDVKDTTDKAEDERKSASTVQLVPEEDPTKAQKAPIKVRIIPPKAPPNAGAGKKPSPPPSTIELPLPVKDAVKLPPKDSGEDE
jgi:cytoskeletal protein RodZ